MEPGRVEGIYISPEREVPLTSVEEVEAKAGLGLVGDRYFKGGPATFGRKWDPSRAITLIEREAIEAAAGAYNIQLAEGDSRRNIVTKGVALKHLVGKEFSVGEVRLRGVKLCEPCGYLESLTQPGTREALIHRGGLRAEILADGVIRLGDPVSTS